MKGDFSRYTFDATKHYSAVFDQQGRVRTDADKHEEVEIESHLRESALRDIVGQSGAPEESPGFRLRRSPQGLLLIGAGHYYVDGILCENDEEISFTEQPDLPDQVLPSVEGDRRRVLAYLDVWKRHITSIEDPSIREVALGGPDTTTRLRTVWQVRLVEVDDDANCLGPLPQWEDAIAPSDGQLAARARPPEDSDDFCIVSPDARYTGLDNRLYRVEICQGGGPGEATFVWDDVDGSDAFPIEEFVDEQATDRIKVGSAGRSGVRSIDSADAIEVTDDRLELSGGPGLLRRVESIEPATGIIVLDEPVNGLSEESHPKVRRWSGGEDVIVEIGTFIPLENGVEVRFEGTRFRTGDYWLIPARTATRNVEWPADGEEPLAQPPLGIRHHYCRLGVLDFSEGDFDVVQDCRIIFPALSQRSLKVERVETATDNRLLAHNAMIRPRNLQRGLNIEFNAPLSEDVLGSPALVGQSINPALVVQLHLPEPYSPEDREFWGLAPNEFFGFRAVTLASSISLDPAQRERLQWRPDQFTRTWLQRLFTRLIPPGDARPIVGRLLCTLRVRGDFVWADDPQGHRVFLDGETVAHPDGRAGFLDLPSGNGQRGGDFYTWFWIVSDDVEVPLSLFVEVRLNVVSGVVSSGGGSVEGASVRLRRNSGVGAGSEQTTRTDDAGRFSFTALAGDYTVIAEALGATAEEDVEVGPVIVAPGGGGGGGLTGPGSLSVREINGIGETRAGLLAAHDVRTLSEFVRLSDDRIAAILSVSVERAREFLVDARRRMERP